MLFAHTIPEGSASMLLTCCPWVTGQIVYKYILFTQPIKQLYYEAHDAKDQGIIHIELRFVFLERYRYILICVFNFSYTNVLCL